MPQKSSPHMRTWGTRFDTLPTSPPVSPQAHEATTAQKTMASNGHEHILDVPKKKEDKMPHDASVFVGSLPSGIDQLELTRLLSEHLSEHTEVKNIKVVRDSKGGVCAFVQCEDATSAATLIHTLHSNPPKPFLGRTLRYEPARAFRTLLISYRAPMQYIPANNVDGHSTTGNYHAKEGQTVELDLPYAMRAWRPKNSKFSSIVYNAEAIDAENHARANHTVPMESVSLCLHPVVFDTETIRTLATYFGRLERFSPYQISENICDSEDVESGETNEIWKLYPTPHDAPRSSGMDTTCWEIKWDHRDDCVSALMTLRRVPHLTVTWAHQPPSFGFEQRSPYQSNQSPHFNVTPYPFHINDRLQPIPRRGSLTDSTDVFHAGGSAPTIKPSHTATVTGSVSTMDDDDDGWKTGHSNELQDSAPLSQNNALVEVNDENAATSATTRVEWSEMDFPPLGDSKGDRKAEYGVWSDKKPSKEEAEKSPPPTLSHVATPRIEAVQFATLDGISEGVLEYEEQELDMPPTPALGMSPLTPKTPGSLFPITPTNTSNDLQRLSFREYDVKDPGYYGDFNRGERELDPTTLFVGGLETFGEGAWDEEKVGNFFARFGGLESVKVVRPLNSHVAFAFVKFNNTESPARAVFEEHNRVYEGRAMRVQLRDCNPPRGGWRYNRGRGRFQQQHLNSSRRYPDHARGPFGRAALHNSHDQNAHLANNQAPSSALAAAGGGDGDAATEPESPAQAENNSPKPAEGSSDDIHTRNTSTESRPSSSEPSTAPLNTPSQSEGYREWYDEPVSAALTPPPPSFSSATSAPVPASALPYPMSGGYYATPQWMQPYAPQIQYQMPYFGGYPGYPVASHQTPQTFTSPPGSDVSGTSGAAQSSWPSIGMYGSYIPYSAQPARAHNMDPAQSQHLNSRAPLVPTGFIQNEQGTLIAVYQPEALDQYMAGAHVVPPTLSQPPVQNTSSWPQYPQAHSYAFPAPGQTIAMPSRPSLPPTANVAWVPNQGFISQQQAPHASQPLNVQTSAFGFRGGYNDIGMQPNGPPLRRHAARRDQHNTYNQGRNNQPRSFTSRHSRGNMSNTGYHGGENHTRSSQNSGDWSQWGPGR